MKNCSAFALFFLFLNTSFGQDNIQHKLNSLFESEHSKKAFNGNILIADQGNIILNKSYGIANEADQVKLDTKTIFELASVSKQFTAMGIVLLAKQGKLNYDDYISKYIPELAFYGNITVRNLLNHTSGLPDYMDLFHKNGIKRNLQLIRISSTSLQNTVRN